MRKQTVSRRFLHVFLILLLCVTALAGCGRKQRSEAAGAPQTPAVHTETPDKDGAELREDGVYTSPEEVAAYLHTYGHLPGNYITKKEAEALGWKTNGQDLSDVAPGMSIGGNRFGNYEGLLPDDHDYYECDVNYDGGNRGPERLVYSEDGLIFYTADHYESFEQLY